MCDLENEIKKLKQEKNAVIMAHYYVSDELQKLADFIGDSFYLAKVAKTVDADTICFCGVSFMGESAKILNPGKKVLVPDLNADCPMAHMVNIERIKELRSIHEDLAVVCYINSTAELKSYSDVCVTSSNAVQIVRALPNKNIFFIPDENLGRYVAEQVPEKNVILNDGYCPIHKAINIDALKKSKQKHPAALVLAHPECKSDVLKLADFIGSTAAIIKFATENENNEFIVCTEEGVAYELMQKNPDKKFYFDALDCPCKDMKLNTPKKLLKVLQSGENEIFVDDKLREKALIPLEKMLEMAR